MFQLERGSKVDHLAVFPSFTKLEETPLSKKKDILVQGPINYGQKWNYTPGSQAGVLSTTQLMDSWLFM